MATPDVLVLGLGGAGSAAAAHLAARGASVLGLEQFTPGHALGSSHGDSRVIRQAYFEDPAYVPLLRRAYELWADLDATDPGILTITGGLMVGHADSQTVAGSLGSAREHGLAHEMLDAAGIRERFPMFAPADDLVALFEERSGFVRPERTVLEHLRRAAAGGADLRFGERVLGWTASDRGVTVRTAEATYDAGHLVLAPGAWAPGLLADLGVPLRVERRVMHWFEPVGSMEPWQVGRHPVWIWEESPDVQSYGFPAYGDPADGVKVALYGAREPDEHVDPDALDRVVHPDKAARLADHLATRLPALPGRHLRGVACMYTTAPDEHFVVARHPGHATVTVATGFSGHGFKFVPVLGEVLADLALDGSTRHPIALFDPARF
ncbi:N-methyl-L-tryptophan oxidase [Nocardioides guangzhouensis]|uniref:N-methyl-L-tryptophan oxidase n=1 Tax=Nocardioides guangzhouensis TaxID=2497878 RepID=A0A4Q4Z3P0_9ACTN|nr:N-methyl-L-tryptophan oxidase [Nocardioides guangzhouensis]RYP82182.1 N-methyl-L-tryptophan oxidase [Nocardioides guangzhouensis]